MKRVSFVIHKGKTILLADLSGCKPKDVIKIVDEAKRVVTAEPRGSVLTLSDFTGTEFTREAVTRMKEVAVYNRPFVKRSALVGAESLPAVYLQAIKTFSQREFHRFESREEAMDWLAEE